MNGTLATVLLAGVAVATATQGCSSQSSRTIELVQLTFKAADDSTPLDAARDVSLTVEFTDGRRIRVEHHFPEFTAAEAMAERFASSLRYEGLLAAVDASGRSVVIISDDQIGSLEVGGDVTLGVSQFWSTVRG